MKHCGQDGCRRAHDAARKRAQRARAAGTVAQAPAIDPKGPVTTLFGHFETAKAAWTFVLTCGVGPATSGHYEDAVEWLEEYVAEAEPTLEEVLGIEDRKPEAHLCGQAECTDAFCDVE